MVPVILYIEDNPDNTVLGKRIIESLGYRYLMASSGQRGLELAELHRPDLILLDINLPDIDGYEVARRLKASPALRGVPIIAVTANNLHGDAEKALTAGCDAYLTKPILLSELRRRMTAFLSESALAERKSQS